MIANARVRTIVSAARLLVSAALLVPSLAWSAPGDLDATFDGDGRVTTIIGSATYVRALVRQSDGKLVTVGDAYPATNADWGLARFNLDGSLDTSFGGTGKVTTSLTTGGDIPYGATQQIDGRLVVVGFASTGPALVRYLTDGTLDASFGTGGKVFTTAPVETVVQQPDGRLVAAGGLASGLAISRYLANGSIDASFGGTGSVSFAGYTLNALERQTDGKLVTLGSLHNGTDEDFELARFNTDGTFDTTFGGTGIVTTQSGFYDRGEALVVQPDGKLVAAGEQPFLGCTVVRYDPNGSLDTSFGGTGILNLPSLACFALVRQANGKLVVGGWTGSDFATVRLNANGSIDSSWAGTGTVVTDFGGGGDSGHDLALQPDGKVVLAGNSDSAIALARYVGDPGSVCGDSQVDAGEQCDDGNVANGDCCSSTCSFEAPGSPCPGGSCNASGTCIAATTTSTSSSSSTSTTSSTSTSVSTTSSTSTSTLPPPCGPAPATGCRLARIGASKLSIRNSTDDTKDQFKWKWAKGAETVPSAFMDPVHGTATYRVCLYDASANSQPLLESDIPPGGTCGTTACWKASGTTAFGYKNRLGTPNGFTSVKLKAGLEGKPSVQANGRGANLSVPPLGLVAPVTAQLVVINGSTTECWQTTYSTPSANTEATFSAKGP